MEDPQAAPPPPPDPSLEQNNNNIDSAPETDVEAGIVVDPTTPPIVVDAVVSDENDAETAAVECPNVLVYALPLEEYYSMVQTSKTNGDDDTTTPTKSATVLQVLEMDEETAVTSPYDSTDSLPTVASSRRLHHHEQESNQQQHRLRSWLLLLFPLALAAAVGLVVYATLTNSHASSSEDGDDTKDSLLSFRSPNDD
eukprot:scaffold2194_cov138-Amphora_coffeaeformis.AAC.1